MSDERAVHDLRELARRDEDLARRAARTRELDDQVGAVRSAAEGIDAFFTAYPAEATRRAAALAVAREELERRGAELRDAEAQLAAASDDDARMHAEHAVERGRDHVVLAEAALRRAQAGVDELERDAASLPAEVPALEAHARAIAAEAPHVHEPPVGPRTLVDWAADAHAQLFVALGALDTQRERVIREANELASMLLGEQTFGATVAQLAERVGPLAGE